MIFERAFSALPELFHGGAGLPFHYEATLASAFAMSVVQVLNSYNIYNPASHIRVETQYPNIGDKRADLLLDLSNPLPPINLAGLREYGWRERNWLEAKFHELNATFSAPAGNTSQDTFLLLADLFRIALYPEEVVGTASCQARYFLHVYRGPPTAHVTPRRNASNGNPAFPRVWLDRLWTPGPQVITSADVDAANEINEFNDQLNAIFRAVDFEFQITNFSFSPRVQVNNAHYCFLTRVDGFTFTHNGRSCSMDTLGNVTESQNGDYNALRQTLGTAIRS